MTAVRDTSRHADTGAWDAHRRARVLAARRDALVERLPRRIAAAEQLTHDVVAWIVDEAIEFAVVGYQPPVHSRAELGRVFWDAATKRVARAREGRYDTVRAGYRLADLAVLEQLPVDANPEDQALAKAELSAALHFACLLEPEERAVFALQEGAGGGRPAGTKQIARELGLTRLKVLSMQRRIEHKHERFAIIYAAGRLCGYLAPSIKQLAEGGSDAAAADSGPEAAARFHLQRERCPTCTRDYANQLRYLRSARFHHQVAALLPASATGPRGRGISLPDWLPDWISRLVAGEPAGTTGQLVAGGAGRGVSAAAATKLASLCLAGAGTLGACLATGVLPLPEASERPAARPTPTATPRPIAAEPRLPHGIPTPTPTATPTPKPTRRAKPKPTPTAQGGTSPRSHEQTPASPAPADAPAGGAGEFDPTYQPSAPAAPAPVPAAPGASEFS